MSDFELDPKDPLSVYRNRPPGQDVKVYMAGSTSMNQALELSFTITMPDNVAAREDGARKLAHSAWHLIAGEPEPDVETYDIEGEVDEELVESTTEAVTAAIERERSLQDALQGFMSKVYANRPKGMTAKWN